LGCSNAQISRQRCSQTAMTLSIATFCHHKTMIGLRNN
jgi:hypothetical protein